MNLDRLRNRRTFILRKPLVSQFQVYVAGSVQEYIDSAIKGEERRKRAEWLSQGIPEHFVNWALELARKWAESIVDFQLRSLKGIVEESELKRIGRELAIKMYRQGLEDVAKKWLEAVTGKQLH